MADKLVELRIWPDGKALLVWDGIEGPDCLTIAKALEEKMGADMDTVEMHPEFYQAKRVRNVLLRDGSGN